MLPDLTPSIEKPSGSTHHARTFALMFLYFFLFSLFFFSHNVIVPVWRVFFLFFFYAYLQETDKLTSLTVVNSRAIVNNKTLTITRSII